MSSKPGAKAPRSTLTNAVLAQALFFASQGVYVNAALPNSKALLETGPVMDMATRDPVEIQRLFHDYPERNLGVVPGFESNLFVLDVDTKNRARGLEALKLIETACGTLPRTLRESTPSGGLHYYYRLNGANIPNGKLNVDGLLGVEVFAKPHNLIAAPSKLGDLHYKVIEQCDIAGLPDLLRDYVLAHFVRRDRTAPVVERNNFVFAEACRMRRHNVADNEAWDKLLLINQRLCSPPLGEPELRKLFRSAWRYEPGYEHTELGNAQLYNDTYGTDLKFVYESKRWLCWDKLRWKEDLSGRVLHCMKIEMRRQLHRAIDIEDPNARKAAVGWAKKSEMKNTMLNSLALVPSEPGMTVPQNALDADAWLLACRNVILDLHSGRPVEPAREQLITKSAAVDFDSDARCPRFMAFLEQIVPSAAVREFLKRYFGYALTSDMREQCMLICWGKGSNGKSTLLNAMLSLMGDYGTQAAAQTWLVKRDTIPNDVAALAGKRLVISTEFNEGERIAASLLKSAIGQDTIKARFMRAEWFDMIPQFKIAFGTNHKPLIDGSDGAMVRRLRLVQFGVQVPEGERDLTLPDTLKTELPGILNWALDGCLAWQRDGLTFPDEVRKSTNDYAQDSDSLGQFVLDCCERGALFASPAQPLYVAYMKWCEANGHRPLNASRFKQALIDRGHGSKRAKTGVMVEGLKLLAKHQEVERYNEY